MLALFGPVLVLAKGVDETRLTESSRRFEIFDEGIWEEKQAALDTLRTHHGLSAHSLCSVLRDLNREAKEATGKVHLFRDEKKRNRRRRFYDASGSFSWNHADRTSTNWYPQGVSGSGDANLTGSLCGKEVLLVSWYARKTPHKGSRISVVDVTDPKDIRYRHVLLVEPFQTKTGASFRPVKTHAGGIFMYKNLLFVADSRRGVRVFDTLQIMRAEADRGKSKVGVLGTRANAFDYRYVLPMIGRYSQPSRGGISFSFMSLDRSTAPHAMWVGEYEERGANGYATRFVLDARTGRIEKGPNGRIVSTKSFRLNRSRTQGFVEARGDYYYNHSYAEDQYRIHVQKPHGYRALKGGYGLEDLYYDSRRDRLWFVAEHPGSRKVFFMDAPQQKL
jgi:hypothetical protein